MKYILLIDKNRKRALVRLSDPALLATSVATEALAYATYSVRPDSGHLHLVKLYKNTIGTTMPRSLDPFEVPVACVIRARLPVGVDQRRMKFRIGYHSDDGFMLPSVDYIRRYADIEFTELRHG